MEEQESNSSGTSGRDGRRPRRQFMKGAGATGIALGLAGCSQLGGNSTSSPTPGDTETATPTSSGGGDGSYKIGLLGPGLQQSSLGISMRIAAEIAVAEANQKFDYDLELVTRDTQESPEVARQVYDELIEDENVDATAGVFRSEVMIGLMDKIAESGVVHMSSGSAASQTTLQVKEDYESYRPYFRAGPLNDVYIGRSMVDYARDAFNDYGFDKVGILLEGFAWTQKIEQVWAGDYSGLQGFDDLDVEVVNSIRYPGDTEDFTQYYNQFAEADVDAVIPAMTTTGNAAILQWAQNKYPFAFTGVHVPMQLPQYYEAVNGASRYGVTWSLGAYEAELTPKTLPFVEEYNQRSESGSNPVYTGFATYDSVAMWAETLAENGSAATDDMVPALENKVFTGTAGTIDFMKQGGEFPHDPKYGVDKLYPVFLQWQEEDGVGVQRAVWPDALAASPYQSPSWIDN